MEKRLTGYIANAKRVERKKKERRKKFGNLQEQDRIPKPHTELRPFVLLTI